MTTVLSPSDGFHPISTTNITFTNHQVSPSNCTLHLYFSLPPLIFVDPYELAHHAHFYTFKHWGTANLELPVHAVPQNNSILLINLNTSFNDDRPDSHPEAGESDVGIEVKVPLHLRYGDPSSASDYGYHTADLDWPTGFLACSKTPQRVLRDQTIPVLPPEILSFLDVQTSSSPVSLVAIPPANHSHEHHLNHPRIKVRVPVGNPNDLRFVEPGMVIMILMSFFYLVWISSRTARRIGAGFGSVESSRLKTE